jgi:hypothetical protein
MAQEKCPECGNCPVCKGGCSHCGGAGWVPKKKPKQEAPA